MKKWLRVGFIVMVSLVVAIVPMENAFADAAVPYYLGIDHYGGGCDPTASPTTGGAATTLPVEKEIGQLLNVGFDVNSFTQLSASATKYDLGGVFPHGTGTGGFTKAAIKTLDSSLTSDLIVATDDEGGQITRFDPGTPSAQALGGMSDAAVKADGVSTAQKSAAFGANVNLAPVLDVGSAAYNSTPGFGTRAFSNTASVVADKAGAYADGVTSQNMGVAFKHFPGLGATPSGTSANTDIHKDIINESIAQLEQSDLVPYQKLKGTKNSMIMLGNMAVSGWGAGTPVSQNPKAIDYITSTLGFNGPILTDDLAGLQSTWSTDNATAVTNALNAGATMPLISYTSDAQLDSIVSAVKSGVTQSKIDAAYQKIIGYKNSLGLNTSKAGLTNSSSQSSGTVSGSVFMVGDSITVKAIQEGSIQKDFKTAGASSFFATGVSGSTLVTNASKSPEYNTDSPTKAVSNSSPPTQDTLVDKYKSKIASSNTVIIASGTNGIPDAAAIKETVKKIQGYNAQAKIYWVDAATTSSSAVAQISKADQLIYANNQASNYTTISWSQILDPSRDPSVGNSVWTDTNNYLDSDGIHPSNPNGIQKWAATVVNGAKSVASTSTTNSDGSVCCDTGSTVTSISGTGNVEKLLNYLMSSTVGLNLTQATGAAGSMQIESGDDLSPSVGNGLGFFGIAQWGGARYTNLKSYASAKNTKWDDIDTQIHFLGVELGVEDGPGKGGQSATLTRMKQAKSPTEASDVWTALFEGATCSPIGSYGSYADGCAASQYINQGQGYQLLKQRQPKATALYSKYQDGAPLTSGSDDQAYETSATSTCGGSSASPGSVASLQQYVLKYAWPDYHPAPYTQKTAAYASAISTAKSQGRYVGADGIDCGGFVTTLLYDSGFDKTYNSDGKGGPTTDQEAWAKKNWKYIGSGATMDVADLNPGDVALINDSTANHTWIYVGKIPGFNSTFASASLNTRAPMADKYAQTGNSYANPGDVHWYEKK